MDGATNGHPTAGAFYNRAGTICFAFAALASAAAMGGLAFIGTPADEGAGDALAMAGAVALAVFLATFTFYALIAPLAARMLAGIGPALVLGLMLVTAAWTLVVVRLIAWLNDEGFDSTIVLVLVPIFVLAALPSAFLWQRFGDPRLRERDLASAFD